MATTDPHRTLFSRWETARASWHTPESFERGLFSGNRAQVDLSQDLRCEGVGPADIGMPLLGAVYYYYRREVVLLLSCAALSCLNVSLTTHLRARESVSSIRSSCEPPREPPRHHPIANVLIHPLLRHVLSTCHANSPLGVGIYRLPCLFDDLH